MKKTFWVKLTTLTMCLCCYMMASGCSSSSPSNDEVKPGPVEPTPDPQTRQFTFFQINIWHECTKLPTAYDALAAQIASMQPDVVSMCELFRGENESDAVLKRLIKTLGEKGLTYYSATQAGNGRRGILSKYPIEESVLINAWMFKAIINFHGQRVALYASHAYHRYYACYWPRGYSDGGDYGGGGGTVEVWDKLEAPITDAAQIEARNALSLRAESVADFVKSAKEEIAKGSLVMLGGDFNEPSHLDWTAATKDMMDHNGAIVNWNVSSLLYKEGFLDSYRVKYPDPVKNPGVTFPADNKGVGVELLTWAPDADERDRIDFVYYNPDSKVVVEDAQLVGPDGMIIKSQRVKEQSEDKIIPPANGNWPTDHRGVFITFKITN